MVRRRRALNQLAGKSDKLMLQIAVEAHAMAGLDPSHINIQVKELLTETDGVEFEAVLSDKGE